MIIFLIFLYLNENIKVNKIIVDIVIMDEFIIDVKNILFISFWILKNQ